MDTTQTRTLCVYAINTLTTARCIIELASPITVLQMENEKSP